MGKSTTKANEIIKLINQGETINKIRDSVSSTEDEWFRYSCKAYRISLENAKKERKAIMQQKHVSAASNAQILEIIALNDKLADYALVLPIFAITGEFQTIKNLAEYLPTTETQIIQIIGKATLQPRLRAIQKKGRIEKFTHFNVFSKLIDAAILSYYRTNFISCYLTLLPVIEGILIRLMGYTEVDTKPKFKDVRKFFKKAAQRQPCPYNILFHNVYVKACDKILNHHFYKPTTSGNSWANFNRHVAAHLLNDEPLGTKANCVRLFVLLDLMTEVFLYESRMTDPNRSITNDQLKEDIELYNILILENTKMTPEQIILGTDISDLAV